MPTKHLWSDGLKEEEGMPVWVCREQRGRSGSTRGLPGGLPELKEGTEDQPEGGQGGAQEESP